MMNKINEIREQVAKIIGTDYIVEYREINKLNDTKKHSLNIRKKGDSIASCMYIDDLLNKYNQPEIISSKIVKDYFDSIRERDKYTKMVDNIKDWNIIKDNLRLKIINTKLNKEILTDIPHNNFEDLSLIILATIPEISASVKVNLQLLNMWNKTFEEVFEIATKNTYKDVLIQNMSDIQKNLVISNFVAQGYNEEEAKKEAENLVSQMGGEDMIVITNSNKIFGAVNGFNPENIIKAMDILECDDVVIIPSSIHEVIVIKGTPDNIDEFCNLISSVNENEVVPEEILNNHPYFYNRKLGWIK